MKKTVVVTTVRPTVRPQGNVHLEGEGISIDVTSKPEDGPLPEVGTAFTLSFEPVTSEEGERGEGEE